MHPSTRGSYQVIHPFCQKNTEPFFFHHTSSPGTSEQDFIIITKTAKTQLWSVTDWEQRLQGFEPAPSVAADEPLHRRSHTLTHTGELLSVLCSRG